MVSAVLALLDILAFSAKPTSMSALQLRAATVRLVSMQ
jgi:hypothetical protein